MNYQIASKTTKGRKKDAHERNGDYCLWLDEQEVVILALADGVGSCADDYRASHTLCDRFVAKCREAVAVSIPLTEGVLSRFCREIDPVLGVDNDMACFCAVVWYKGESRCAFLHVGDTRIYHYSIIDGLRQVTVDDHGKAVSVKVGGKLYTDHGAVVSAVPINKAIGDGGLSYNTGSIPFREGEGLILCSDGMYQSSSFGQDMSLLLNASMMSETVRSIGTTDDDDATLLVLRRNVENHTMPDIKELMSDFEGYSSKWPLNALVGCFADEIGRLIDSDSDTEQLASVIRFAKEHSLYPGKVEITRLFESAVAASKAHPEKADGYRQICGDLGEMLQKAHRQVGLI